MNPDKESSMSRPLSCLAFLSLFCLLAIRSGGQEELVPLQVPAIKVAPEHEVYTLVRVGLDGISPKQAHLLIMAVRDGRLRFLNPEPTSAGWVFTGPPGVYHLRAVCDSDVDGLCILEAETVIRGGSVPPPPPDDPPGPDDPPDPPLPPAGKFGFAEAAKLAPMGAARQLASKLSESYEAVASRAAAGSLSTPQAMISEALAKNQEICTGNEKAWKPWADKWVEIARANRQAGKLTSLQDHIDAFNETAESLKAVK